MKRNLTITFLTALLVVMTGCHKDKPQVHRDIVPITLTDNQKSLVVSNNAFGFDIFRTISSSEDPNQNVFISPLSISLALAMTYNGANGDTRTEMQNTLRFPDFSADEINGYFQKLSTTLTGIDPLVNLGIANSIWYRQDFSVLPDFLTVNRIYYNAEVQPLDFNSPASVTTINNWVAKATNNRITQVIDQVTPDEVMFLINAIYFKGQWTYAFDRNATADGSFNTASGSQSTLSFMHQQGSFQYAINDSLQILEMPYGQGNFSMMVLLPVQGHSVSALANGLTPATWGSLTGNLFTANVNIAMPKFTFQYERKLNYDLIALGMGKAFSAAEADFTKINAAGGLYISFVKHNSFVEVNEEGTEAAAVTAVGISLSMSGSDPQFIPFIVDHPFVFAIMETTTNTNLFIGKVVNL